MGFVFQNGQWVSDNKGRGFGVKDNANDPNIVALNQLLSSPQFQALSPEQKQQASTISNAGSLQEWIGKNTFNNGEGGSLQAGGINLTGNPGQNALNPYDAYKAQVPIINQNPDADQNAFIQQLQQRMSGQGPSVAQSQLKAGTDANMAQQLALAHSGASGGSPLALRQAAIQAAHSQQQMANEAAGLRAQEISGASGALGQAILGRRGQDLGISGQNAANVLQAEGLNMNQDDNHAQNSFGNQLLHAIPGALGAGAALASGGMGGGAAGGGAAAGGGGGLTYVAQGGQIPGSADAPGDSRKNDTVPAMLSPGEVVLPRSVALSPDAPEKAAEFVRAIQERSKPQIGGYGQVLAHQRMLHERMEHLEKIVKGE